jgi:alanine racemase
VNYASSWIELSKKNFDRNASVLRSFLPPSVAISAVLKSNAYGHGLVQMGLLVQNNNQIDRVCTFYLQEALALRAVGVTKPMLVIGYVDAPLEEAIRNDIAVLLHSRTQLNDLDRCARAMRKKVAVHLKVDTGMSRLGFLPEQIQSVINEIYGSFSSIQLDGIMTHYSEADGLDAQWTRIQIGRFVDVLNDLKHSGVHIPLIHATNSSGSLRYVDSHFSMVRIGGALYGLPKPEHVYDVIRSKIDNFSLRPVLTFKSRIIDIKDLPIGSFVGYDRLFVATAPTRSAVVPIGYYDGYGRRRPAGLRVLINGCLAPVLGSVCMNVIMVDVSHIPDVAVGDVVTAIGDHDGIRVSDISPLINGTNYEITTMLNQGIPRFIVE